MWHDWRAEAAAIPDLVIRSYFLRRVYESAPQAEREAVWWAMAETCLEGVRGLVNTVRERTVAHVGGEDYDPWAAGF